MMEAEVLRLRQKNTKRQRPVCAPDAQDYDVDSTVAEGTADGTSPRQVPPKSLQLPMNSPKRKRPVAGTAAAAREGPLAAAGGGAAATAAEAPSPPSEQASAAQRAGKSALQRANPDNAEEPLLAALRGALKAWPGDGCRVLRGLHGDDVISCGKWSVRDLASAIIEIVCDAAESVDIDDVHAQGWGGLCATVRDVTCVRVLWQLTALLDELVGDVTLAHCGLGTQLRGVLESIVLRAAADVKETETTPMLIASRAEAVASHDRLAQDGACDRAARAATAY